jgi:hypothetical protein
MQIHLSDCKSLNPLIRGLGVNKLQLCMLVLSELRETYWSAGVMYRLFERAQCILSNSAPTDSTSGISSTSSVTQIRSNRNSQSYIPAEVQQPRQQEQLSNEVVTLLPQGPHVQLNDEAPPPWFNTSPQFGSVDQLLSPGFSLSENIFQDFFPGYDSSIAYDPIAGAIPNGIGDSIVYDIQ